MEKNKPSFRCEIEHNMCLIAHVGLGRFFVIVL